MEIVYYFDDVLVICPVKHYLYSIKLSHDRKLRLLAEIDQKIKFVAINNGRPTPPISLPLHNYNFFEIKSRKDKNTVIRILYFRYKNVIVLLNAFEKPDNYTTNKERAAIEKYYETTNDYYRKFINNPNNYERYQ
ncbi:MAG: hypothetical protein WCK37_04430 [Candidatus Falkowbacteria bacterium]